MNCKRCFKCGLVKDLVDFYKHKKMADGYLNKCKECAKKDSLENRKNNTEYYRAYDIVRGRHPSRSRDRYNKSKKGRRIKARAQKKWELMYPERVKAYSKINRAIKSGGIKPKSVCEVCFSQTKLQGHHPDYSKPLNVIWVCTPCHAKIHHGEKFKDSVSLLKEAGCKGQYYKEVLCQI